MFAFQAILVVITTLLFQEFPTLAEPIRENGNSRASSSSNGNINLSNEKNFMENEFYACEEQLSKYRRFLLQAIISFEDVCDAYNTRPPQMLMSGEFYRAMPQSSSSAHEHEYGLGQIFRNYQPPEARTEIWAFFKLLMAQFNDVEFANVVHDAIIERCRTKSQLQHDEKRNSVVLGKKQRFHSWGGKRNPAYFAAAAGDDVAGNTLEDFYLWKKQMPSA